jgi:hypothetical protein
VHSSAQDLLQSGLNSNIIDARAHDSVLMSTWFTSQSVFSGFGIPIHLGVLFVYSRYASPYCLRQAFSSEVTMWCSKITTAIVTSRKIHERQAIRARDVEES